MFARIRCVPAVAALLLFPLISAVALAACGGGAGEERRQAPAPPQATAPPEQTASAGVADFTALLGDVKGHGFPPVYFARTKCRAWLLEIATRRGQYKKVLPGGKEKTYSLWGKCRKGLLLRTTDATRPSMPFLSGAS